MKTTRKKNYVWRHAVLIFFSVLTALPFVWMLLCSTNTSVDILRGRITPGTNLLVNIRTLIDTQRFLPAFKNSVVYTVTTTALAVIISSLAGYAFVVYRSKAKDFVMSLILMSMMIPIAAILIPMFRLFSRLKLLNTMTAFMLPSLATAFLIFLFRQATLSFPSEIIQAARIDGVSEFGIFFKIFVPIMKPTYATAIVMTFMNVWNSFLWPLVVMTDAQKTTMPVFLSLLTDSGYTPDYGAIMLAVSVTTLPTLIIFFVLQKSFINGLAGSVKG